MLEHPITVMLLNKMKAWAGALVGGGGATLIYDHWPDAPSWVVGLILAAATWYTVYQLPNKKA